MGEGTRGVREGRRMSFEERESDDKLVSSVAGSLCSRDRLLLCIGRGRLARAGLVRRRPRGTVSCSGDDCGKIDDEKRRK